MAKLDNLTKLEEIAKETSIIIFYIVISIGLVTKKN